jgi:hypothetical protein
VKEKSLIQVFAASECLYTKKCKRRYSNTKAKHESDVVRGIAMYRTRMANTFEEPQRPLGVNEEQCLQGIDLTSIQSCSIRRSTLQLIAVLHPPNANPSQWPMLIFLWEEQGEVRDRTSKEAAPEREPVLRASERISGVPYR